MEELMNDHIREILDYVRTQYDERGAQEVETSVEHPVVDGAKGENYLLMDEDGMAEVKVTFVFKQPVTQFAGRYVPNTEMDSKVRAVMDPRYTIGKNVVDRKGYSDED